MQDILHSQIEVYIHKLAILHFPIRDLLKHKVDQGCPCSKYPDKLLIPFLSSDESK